MGQFLSRAAVAALLLRAVVASLPAAAATPDLSLVPPWSAPSAADTLDHDVRRARHAGDAAAFGEANARLWALLPHRGQALEALVLWHRDQGTLSELRPALAAGRAEEFCGLPGLDAADLALLSGMADYDASRLTTALATLETIDPAAPVHGYAMLYRYYILGSNRGPAAERIAAINAALTDPLSSCDAVEALARLQDMSPDRPIRAAALDLLRSRTLRPQTLQTLRCEEALDALAQPGLTLESASAVVAGLFAQAPEAAGVYIDDFCDLALTWLPPEEVLALLAPYLDRLSPRQRTNVRSEVLLSGLNDELAAVQAGLADAAAAGRRPEPILMRPARSWHPDAAQTEQWTRAAVDEDLDRFFPFESILRDRGLVALADSLEAEFARENPGYQSMRRARRLEDRDPQAALALCDSLDAVAGGPTLMHTRLYVSEMLGDTACFANLSRIAGPCRQVELLDAAAGGALARGDAARLAALADWLQETAPRNTCQLRNLIERVLHLEDLDLAARLIERYAGLGGTPAAVAVLRYNLALKHRDTGTMRSLADVLLAAEPIAVDGLGWLVFSADGAGWPEVADAAVARLEAAAPDAPQTLKLQAYLALQRQDREAALGDLERLRADWPGSDEYRDFYQEAGGTVEVYRAPAAALVAEAFGALSLEYEATDWITAGVAAGGEFPEAALLILRDRTTCSVVNPSLLISRRRLTFQVLNEGAADALSTVRIPFAADGVAPRLLVARTVTPAGQVQDVPATEILTTAHEGDETDVSDTRDLVVPFAGLRPGMIVDYCVEQQHDGWFTTGISWRQTFGNVAPQREEIFECIVPTGIEVRWVEHGGLGEPERRPLGTAVLHRWVETDVPALVEEEGTPAFAPDERWIGLTTVRDWDEVAEAFGRGFWPRATATDDVAARTAELCAGLDDDRARVDAVYEYLRDDIDNIGFEFGSGRVVPTPAHQVLDRGFGDCKDKTAAMIAMLGSLGIDCQPVLVGTRPGPEAEPGYPTSKVFDHVLAYVPRVDGGLYCDPTLGSGCAGELPAYVDGLMGLRIARDGTSKLTRLPAMDTSSLQCDITVDLYPEEGGRLRAEAEGTFNANVVGWTRYYFDLPSPETHAQVADLLLGNRLSETMKVVSWDKEDTPCGGMRVTAVLRDSSWADPSSHSASLVWRGMAEDTVDMPEKKERVGYWGLDGPFRNRLVLRAHEDASWRLDERHTALKAKAKDFNGQVKVERREQDDDRWLEITRDVEFSSRLYAPADFPDVRNQFLNFQVACFQPLEWQRQSDEARLAQLQDYCRAHPDDHAFAVQAVLQVLGDDMGGHGQMGVERRELAREMLAPVLADPETVGMPFLVAVGLETTDQHYARADSILAIGLAREPRNLYLLGMGAQVSLELDDLPTAIERTRAVHAQVATAEVAVMLINLYLRSGLADEAARQEEQLKLLMPDVDDDLLYYTRIATYLDMGRLEEAEALLDEAGGRLDPGLVDMLRVGVTAGRRDWLEAIRQLEPLQDQQPLNPGLNNDLAWYLACAGRDLERAEYLARMSLALNPEEAGTNNTLALVLLRLGHREEAEATFRRLARDDRPGTRAANLYFVGLIEWLAGDREPALATWRSVGDRPPHNDFVQAAREALDAVAAGEDPSWLYVDRPAEDN